MESTELQDVASISNQTFFTPAISLPRPEFVSDNPYLPKAQNEHDEEYITELNRRITNYMLQDVEKHHQKSSGGGSGSPQSTLWSPFTSGYNSPIGPSRESSPPPLSPIHAMEKTMTKPVTIPFPSKQALIDNQIRSVQANFHNIKKEKEKQRNDDILKNKARNYHQQRPRSGVFVGGSGSRTGSGGTGVFLPRGHRTVVESHKKSGCSTVTIPARVVEALKVHFDKFGVPSSYSSDIPPLHDALLVSMKDLNNRSNKRSSLSRVQTGPTFMVWRCPRNVTKNHRRSCHRNGRTDQTVAHALECWSYRFPKGSVFSD